MWITINKETNSDLYNIKGLVASVLDKLNSIIKDESVLFDIKLILNELLINGVIHGNKQNKDKSVSVSVKANDRFIRIEVNDEGKGFKYNKKNYNPMELKPNGRGLIIVDGLSDEFYIEGNKVVSVKYLKKAINYNS
ncbi:ATP-binding protein [Thermohalobacter berrensis]|uniref:Histidine kinase/HSP90-like ATPase domain-containing protein n=1 Tax=Thermohalobacter berrensis TaxID=99594 RepID=A0A419SUQ9_9FIRM|nr:ATP-binding protein [Thermohalobacter berrensis]RKD28965.1 hypothetical protein BET03_06325 [Thermohalobacter berrensis]